MPERADDRGRAACTVPALLRALRIPRTRPGARPGDAPPPRRTDRVVPFGNAGAVQGGTTSLPGTRPDDGRLDLLLPEPQGLRGWTRAVRALPRGRVARSSPAADTGYARGGPSAGAPVEYRGFRRAESVLEPAQPRKPGGGPVTPGSRPAGEAGPGALTVPLPERGK